MTPQVTGRLKTLSFPNLVDPSVAWELKNIYLLRYQAALAYHFQQDHGHSQPPTTEPLHAVSSTTISHDEVIAQNFKDSDTGLYNQNSRRKLGRFIMLNAQHYGRNSVSVPLMSPLIMSVLQSRSTKHQMQQCRKSCSCDHQIQQRRCRKKCEYSRNKIKYERRGYAKNAFKSYGQHRRIMTTRTQNI